MAMFAMLILGGIFGSIGIAVAHLLTKHAGVYYLILLPAFVLAIILGLGLRLGAKIGRCSRFNLFPFLLVTLFVLGSYASVLFLDQYHDSFETPPSFVDEKIFLIHDTWNVGAELPFVSDYVKPITVPELRKLFADIPVVSDFISLPEAPEPAADAGESDSPEASAPARPHLASQVTSFFSALPEQALSMDEPVLIGTIFNLAIFAPIEDRLEYSGITRWETDTQDGEAQEGDAAPDTAAPSGTQSKALVFDERAVQPWMQWSAELLLIWLIVLLMTLGGTKKARRRLEKRQRKREQPGLQVGATPPPAKAQETPAESEVEEESGKKKKKKKKKVKKEKRGGWFGRKKKKTEAEPPDAVAFPEEEGPAAETPSGGEDELEFEIPGEGEKEEQLLALILHQYAPERQEDLIRLIQQIGQVSESRARRLLKVPSLIKRDITPHEANIAIEKFNQVQAQVKLITMDQLQQLQNKQQQSVQPQAPKAPEAKSAPPEPSLGTTDTSVRYALILRKFDQARRKEVLELLSGLSGNPVSQIQQSLKTPALVLRDASKDEATMIVQQFKMIQADVKMLTMPELQKLMAKK